MLRTLGMLFGKEIGYPLTGDILFGPVCYLLYRSNLLSLHMGSDASTDWARGYVILFHADALFVYFAVALYFPDLTSVGTSLCLKSHYYSIHRPFFISISAAIVSNYLSTAVMIDSFEVSAHDIFLLALFRS